jgi:hypothetical protein
MSRYYLSMLDYSECIDVWRSTPVRHPDTPARRGRNGLHCADLITGNIMRMPDQGGMNWAAR